MVMLLIGLVLIGYLLYFSITSFREWQRARVAAGRHPPAGPIDLIDGAQMDDAEDVIEKLEARINVLERLIDKPDEPASRREEP